MYRFFLSIAFALIAVVSCTVNKSESSLSSIEVIYFKGSIETRTRIECGEISKSSSSFRQVDTILIDNEKYIELLNLVKGLKSAAVDSNNCDVRIQCKINYDKKVAEELCIGKFNCLIKGNKPMYKNERLLYLIKNYSRYYDYFPKNELEEFEEVKSYGIPNDYKDLRITSITDSIPAPPTQLIMAVFILPKPGITKKRE